MFYSQMVISTTAEPSGQPSSAGWCHRQGLSGVSELQHNASNIFDSIFLLQGAVVWDPHSVTDNHSPDRQLESSGTFPRFLAARASHLQISLLSAI